VAHKGVLSKFKIYISAALIIISALPVHAGDYLIGSQDVLKITVFDNPDLTTEARVSGEGKITFPLLGEIVVKNLTARQIEKSIGEKLATKGIVKDPQVTAFVQQYNRKVTIIGEVMKPGQYEIPGRATVLDMISLALGMNQNAGYRVTVFRKEPDADGRETTKKISIDMDGLLNGGNLAQNIELQDQDVVYVPKAIFYVYGEVNKPGSYRLEKGVTVKRAIAMAGGLTAKGSQRRIEITRKDGDKESSASAHVDDLVRIDDVIKIKESIF